MMSELKVGRKRLRYDSKWKRNVTKDCRNKVMEELYLNYVSNISINTIFAIFNDKLFNKFYIFSHTCKLKFAKGPRTRKSDIFYRC